MRPLPGDTFDATIARAVASAIESGLVGAADVLDGDLAVGPDPRYGASEHHLLLACIAHERHWALTWLTSDDPVDWDRVDPST